MGYGAGQQVEIGLKENTIDGAIFSPKDLSKQQIIKKITSIQKANPDADIYIDPQFYAWETDYCSNKKLGSIQSWNYLQEVSNERRLPEKEIKPLMEKFFLEMQKSLPELSGIIAPSIYIHKSFLSPEGEIAKQFISIAQKIADQKNETRPIYSTIVMSRDVLLNVKEVKAFLNQIINLDNPPSGFYLLVGANKSSPPNNICNSDVISMWMYLNKVLSKNKFRIINGYSDILSPFLQHAGGYAGATGWWGNLRCFSMERFCVQEQRHRPSRRYLSIALLNRVLSSEYRFYTHQELLKKNKLKYDSDYDKDKETQAIEAFQTWESISHLLRSTTTMDQLKNAIDDAKNNYIQIRKAPVSRLYLTSRNYHLDVFSESIEKYEQLLNS